MSSVAITADRLRADHLADLRAIKRDPRHLIPPRRRDLFSRLGLITPAEPPPAGAPRGWTIDSGTASARIPADRGRSTRDRGHAVTLDLDDLERRAQAAIADARGQTCWHDARTALALIRRIRDLESGSEPLRRSVLPTVAEVERCSRWWYWDIGGGDPEIVRLEIDMGRVWYRRSVDNDTDEVSARFWPGDWAPCLPPGTSWIP